jgi:hypothetical protein
MAYKHDIFISYAHVDNEPLEGIQEGWVSIFSQNLRKGLMRKLGRSDVSVWMDHRDLLGHASLTSQIMEALRETATFLVIVSPGYLLSEWCGREREEFLRLVKERTDSNYRMFLIELDRVLKNEFPLEFSDLIGYRFWTTEKDSRIPRTLGTPIPDPGDQEYYKQLNRVCVEIAEELKRLRAIPDRGSRSGRTAESSENSKPTAFLADVTDDLESRRDDVMDYLKQAGINVVPEGWRMFDSLSSYEHAIDQDLEHCSVFVQLLSSVAGKKPFRQQYAYPWLQYARALESGKPVLQWRDPKAEVDDQIDQNQRALLEGPTVRAEAIEEFKSAVVRAATTKLPPPLPERSSGKLVFVSADKTDRVFAEEIVESSWWDKSVGYAMLPPVSDPGMLRQCLEVGLLNCDAALVIYCGTDPGSVFSQVMHCRRILAQREPPLPIIGLYDGPPPPGGKAPISIMLPNLRVLDCRGSYTALQEFLNTL